MGYAKNKMIEEHNKESAPFCNIEKIEAVLLELANDRTELISGWDIKQALKKHKVIE